MWLTFGGGVLTSNAGALLLAAADRAIGLVERFAACFSDGRSADRVVHDVTTLVGQRVFAIALGYEDLLDHDALRHDPAPGVALDRLEGRRRGCAPLESGQPACLFAEFRYRTLKTWSRQRRGGGRQRISDGRKRLISGSAISSSSVRMSMARNGVTPANTSSSLSGIGEALRTT